RDQIFREVAGSDLPGLVYTCMWDLSSAEDRAYIEEVCDLFRSRGAAVHFVELYAPLEERIRRNRTEQRLAAKPSKRDVKASELRLRTRDTDRVMNTSGSFFHPEHHVRIDNTNLSPREVAEIIINHFQLPSDRS
ncbi:MAG TPA: hypothetical protein VMN60_02775, partial [Longimicrobiales bacterium]|nr:hypothetical protein [Longimicrobiales bacterium]